MVLWSISAVAADWQNAAALTALCTVPDDRMPTAAHWDPAATMFARHILDPLLPLDMAPTRAKLVGHGFRLSLRYSF